jgi:xylulokinase
VWEATVAAARDAIHAAGRAAGADVSVVAVAAQWSSIVPVDATGHPVAPLRMWFDRRGQRFSNALRCDPRKTERWRDVHGLLPSTSLGHVLGFQSETEVHSRASAYLEPVDYLGARFSGVIAATANSSMPLALTDTRRLGDAAWSPELLELAGVDASRLPPLAPSLSVLGAVLPDVAAAIGIPANARVVAGANDSIASAFGSGALDPGIGTIMMGTTGVLVVHHPTRFVDSDKFLVTMPSALDDRYYVVAEGGLGGKLIELALIQIVGDAGDGPPESAFEAMMATAATSPPGANGVLFLPWVFGSLSPAPDLRHRGALLGISMGTTRADVARAMLEGIAMQMRWLVDEVEAATHTRLASIRFVGGGAQSEVWAQIMADVVARPIELVDEPRHANARGAGLMGLVGVGALDLAAAVACVRVRRVFETDQALVDMYTERLAIVRQLHGRLAEPVGRLTTSIAPDHEARP